MLPAELVKPIELKFTVLKSTKQTNKQTNIVLSKPMDLDQGQFLLSRGHLVTSGDIFDHHI